MKKILFCIIGCFMVLPLGADNVTTTKPYVDYHVGQKQDKIPGIPSGTGAIVTYGATDGSIGSAVIVDQIGTSTAESTIPMTGTLVKELNDKMDTVGAGAGFVMAGEIVGGGTSTAHAKKPVYSSTNRYNDALVTAEVVNTAALDATDNELSCLDNDCTLWQIDSAAQLDTTCKASDVPCINSDECCSNSCVFGQCFAACVANGGSCSQNSDCCSGLQCLLNKCSTLEKLCKSDSDCSRLTPYCCNNKCQATECAVTLCAKQGESCASTPCCEELICNIGKTPVCAKKS